MKKILLWVLFAAFGLNQAAAQSAKIQPPAQGDQPSPEQLKFKPWPGKATVPMVANPFGLEKANYQPIGPLVAPATPVQSVRIERGENGLPIFFRGKTAASGTANTEKAIGERALDYLVSLQPAGVVEPAQEFVAKNASNDEQGNAHVRLEQVFQGVPVYGGELIAHTKNGAFELLNGRYYPTPQLATVNPVLDAEAAAQKIIEALGAQNVKTNWTPEERQLVGGQEQSTELVVYHHQGNFEAERLAWHIVIYPNLLRREVYFVDAITGEIIHHFDHTCEISGAHHHQGEIAPPTPAVVTPAVEAAPATLGGPVVASGLDLKNQNRSFGAWMEGSTIYMEDASQPMFNAGASTMPSNPVGVIVALDAQNTSPEVQSTFKYKLVTSGSTVFNDKNAVSTHWNAIKSYDYFRVTHQRNSIDGNGGNILSFFNVSEDNGTSMENAFWNGAAMWYGNGGTTFTELAGGLDVGGHEMTHGVIEKTANLEYQNESGALNESFADVFAVCIDRDDWKIGEDVVRPGATPNNCLRDMQFPNNGLTPQPKHLSEKYTGTQDNGGVHINSGIPNRAFFEFANTAGVGIDKAEKVYYKALRDYLVKSSKFIDCRLAVVQAANDLYGSAVATAAGNAFATVGIQGGQGGNYQGNLAVNPGNDYILSTTNDMQTLQLMDGNGNVLKTLYNEGVASRPSVSDNGLDLVFVNNAGHIIGVSLTYNSPTSVDHYAFELSYEPVWRNAAISKNGNFVAGLTAVENNRITIQDLGDPLGTTETFFLYNPTYSQTPQITGEVRYADVLEFDYSGEFLMYDAFNELSNGQGEDLSYWDIGFLNFWKNGAFTDGATAFISKLFNGLPANASVGNPTFAKNAPYVIALDFIDGNDNRNDILGANTETGDVDYLFYNNGELGWPSYTRLDNAIIYNGTNVNGRSIYKSSVAANRITGLPDEALLVQNREWGTWFANGTRSLMVDAKEPVNDLLQLTAAPNPATDQLRLSFTLPQAGPVQVVVSDLLGRTVQVGNWDLSDGNNQLELNLNTLTAGTYAVRLLAAGTGATLKVVKQ